MPKYETILGVLSRLGIKETALRATKSILGRVGLELTPTRETRTTMWGCLAHLRRCGFEPQTVIDVGVATGTYDLYDSYPTATHLLIEPLDEFKNAIGQIVNKHKAIYVAAAAGGIPGFINLWVKPHTSGSSAYVEKRDGVVLGQERQIRVVKVDDVVKENSLRGPYLLKLDAEGAELEVLKGCTEILNETDVIISEVTFIPKLIGAAAFTDIVRRMDELGYVLYDIFNMSVRPIDRALFQADACFVKQGSPLRQWVDWQEG